MTSLPEVSRSSCACLMLLIGLAGCVPYKPLRVRPGDDLRADAMTHQYASQLIRLSCGAQPAPGRLRSQVGQVALDQACGMVTADLTDAMCAEQPCDDMFAARMRERYPAADSDWVANHCAGYPDQCDTFVEREEQHLRSHNRTVTAAWKRDAAALRANQQREAEARLQGVLQAMAGDEPAPTVHVTIDDRR